MRGIVQRLAKAIGGEGRAALLTGTIRGYERDKLARSAIFQGFRAEAGRRPSSATEYLVATSAGEVGVDLDADHMVCDLSTLDSMIQRLGRVNRLGGREADVYVVEWPKKERKGTDESDVEKRIAATRAGLASLPRRDGAYDASPESLRNLAERTEAFAPTPRMVPLTDILVDNWCLTCVEDLPGRPMPERWLHGVESGEPDLYVAWREEVNDIVSSLEGCSFIRSTTLMTLTSQNEEPHNSAWRTRAKRSGSTGLWALKLPRKRSLISYTNGA
jgi:CRISPR-associated endonuclease/helicase Cas3